MAGVSLPEYPGSSRQVGYLLPIPFFVYRGSFLKVDRQAVRGVFYENPRVEVSVSAGISPPVGNDRDGPREGMSELDPSVELGPMFRWYLARDADIRLSLRFPLRTVAAVDPPRVYHIGTVFNPAIVLDLQDAPWKRWNFSLALGPLFSDSSLCRYYYEVKPGDATAERPAYRPDGGYGGYQTTVTLSRRYSKTWVGAFLACQDINGAVFEDSPLVEERWAVMGGVGVSRILGKSSVMVQKDVFSDASEP